MSRSWRWPTAGVAVAVGLSAAEAGLVLRNLLSGFGEGGVVHMVLPWALVYVALGAAADLGMQALGPRSWAHHGAARGAAALGLAALLGMLTHQLLFSLSLVLFASGLWAALAHRPRLKWLAFALAAGAIWPTLPRSPKPLADLAQPPAQGPDILVVVLDTMRLDHSSTYGYPLETTPALTALAERGVRFDRAWSTAPWSMPSHASMFTGLMPSKHGAHNLNPRMSDQHPLLAELLTQAGYQTAGFTSNPFAGSGTGMARGYTYFEDHWRRFTLNEVLLGWRVLNALTARDRDKGSGQILASVSRWWSQREQGRPSFLFVNFMEPHGPYQEVQLPHRSAFTDAPLGLLEQAGEASHMAQVFGVDVPDRLAALQPELLDGCYRATDARLAELLEVVGPDTWVVALSDHGDMLGERGQWGHNSGLWEPIIHVPMVVAGPGVPAGEVVSDPVSVLDVFATVLGVAQVPAPPHDGVDLGPVMRGERSIAGRLVEAEHPRTVYTTSGWRTRHPHLDPMPHLAARRAVTDGTWKRILDETGRDLGFHLGQDPGELSPLDGASVGLPLQAPVH